MLSVVESTARQILSKHKFICINGTVFEYELGVYVEKTDEEIKKIIIGYSSENTIHKINSILNFIKILSNVDIEAVNNTDYINLKNGLFDYKKKELISHTPDIISTIQLPYGYNPSAVCPKWEKFLKEVLEEDSESISTLQEFFGLCLTRLTFFEKALLLLGSGANGKSVAIYILQRLVGEGNYSTISLSKFDDPHYLIKLFGKTLNASSEIPSGMKFSEENFKRVVTGEDVEADEKFAQPMKFKPFCKLVFGLNTLPYIKDKSDGIYRRLIVMPFDVTFSEEKQNRNLKNELEDELEGIFNWSLVGLNRLLERHFFVLPKKSKAVLAQYKKENNHVSEFIDVTCNVGKSLKITKEELYEAYRKWVNSVGYHQLSIKSFAKSLKSCLPNLEEPRTSKYRFWQGLELKEEYVSHY